MLTVWFKYCIASTYDLRIADVQNYLPPTKNLQHISSAHDMLTKQYKTGAVRQSLGLQVFGNINLQLAAHGQSNNLGIKLVMQSPHPRLQWNTPKLLQLPLLQKFKAWKWSGSFMPSELGCTCKKLLKIRILWDGAHTDPISMCCRVLRLWLGFHWWSSVEFMDSARQDEAWQQTLSKSQTGCLISSRIFTESSGSCSYKSLR